MRNTTALSYLKIHGTISGARTEAIHRFCNRFQGRLVHGSSLGLLSCLAVENEKHLRFNPNKIDGSRETARYGASALDYTRMPIVRMYVYRSTRSIDRVRGNEREREGEKWSEATKNQVRELIPLYLTANISLRLDVSPYNARCFLPIADRSFNYAMPCRSHSPTNNDGQIPDRSRSLPRDRTGLFLKRVCVSRGTIRQCFRFRVMQRDATKLTATLITRTISRSPFHSRLWRTLQHARFSPPLPSPPPRSCDAQQ